MGPYIDGYLLSWLIFMPGLTVLSLLLSNGLFRAFFGSQGMPGEVWRALALSSTSLTAALAWTGMLRGFDAEHLGIQFIEHADWMPGVGLTYFVAVDGISLPLVLLITTASAEVVMQRLVARTKEPSSGGSTKRNRAQAPRSTTGAGIYAQHNGSSGLSGLISRAAQRITLIR